jgi:hypothetical protein
MGPDGFAALVKSVSGLDPGGGNGEC